MNKRNIKVDNLRSILMILVVFGHSLELLRTRSELAQVIYTFIYLFHMPVFIFITGYVSKNTYKGQQNATQNFLVPYLVFNTIWNLIALLTKNITDNATLVESELQFSFFTPGWALWYLLALYVWKILLPDMARMRKPMIVLIFFGLFSRFFNELDTFMSMSRIIVFAPFFMAGYLTQEEDLNQYQDWSRFIKIIVLFLGLVFSLIYVKKWQLPVELLWGDRAYNNFDISILTGFLVALTQYLIGFLFIPFFFIDLRDEKGYLTQVGKNTLPVYIIHPYIIGPLSMFLFTYLDNDIMIIILSLLFSIVVAYLLSRDNVNRLITEAMKFINHFIFRKES